MNILQVENLGKRYRIPPGLQVEQGILKEGFLWALQDVSFELKQGEALGILGRNASGKSTLLRVLARITPPTCGRAVLHGSVSALLEIGTGFHPDLSGRRNVFLNGAFLGMNRREVQNRFDEIVDFSGIGPYIDMPVKYYSSGMFVRLAFAVSAHLEPEILLIDEVLAVGDAAFQKKCLARIEQLRRRGTTFIVVTHSQPLIETLCSKALVLDGGRAVYEGVPAEAGRRYKQILDAGGEEARIGAAGFAVT